MPRPASNGVGGRRRDRLARAHLYVVTDTRPERRDLERFLDVILNAGVDIVQLREKEAEGADLVRWAEVFREAASRHDALFVVNDRPDVAVAAGADGVHLGQGDLSPELTRRLVGPDLIVGLSTHGEDQRQAASSHADYVSVGPIYQTPTKPGRPAVGLDPLRAAARDERRPWFAIGGIDAHILPQVTAAGATRIVVVRAVTDAPDPGEAVRALRRLLPD
jgi:thiamine-phosphate pyrophosphorylase